MAEKVRLDRWLVHRKLAPSRQRAKEMIEEGIVRIDGLPATKPATLVDTARAVTVRPHEHVWVSRGAKKLLSVLDIFGLPIDNLRCADFGSSTGGFTEVLLHRGAQRVHAVDVGKGLLHWRLRNDPKVVLHEGVNARHLESLPEPIDLVVGDLSFISLTKILPAVHRVLVPGGHAIVLVKPQFEVGRSELTKAGKPRNAAARDDAIAATRANAETHGFVVLGGHDSGLAGAKSGNVEHFLFLQHNGQ